MWILLVNQNSERYFLNEKPFNFGSQYYLINESTQEVIVTTMDYLRQNDFRIVGEAFGSENEKLNEILINSDLGGF